MDKGEADMTDSAKGRKERIKGLMRDMNRMFMQEKGTRFAQGERGRIVRLIRVVGLPEIQIGSRRQNAATAGTKDYGQASRHVFDWRQRCRLR
jgi:hypothetical protein